MIDSNSIESHGRRKVKIRIFQPKRGFNTNLLDIDPERSRRLIRAGYEDAQEQLALIKKEEGGEPPVDIAKEDPRAIA